MAAPLTNRAEPIPGYKLLERLGRGGFGEVWKCEAPGGIQKAIKFVYGDLEGASDDGKPAEQEFKALARVKQVRHPFILSLERFDIVEGQLLIVMELADRNLWDRFRDCRTRGLPGIPREELLGYVEEAAEALDLMNTEYKLQHLDIKPQNLFLIHNHIKVADFGLVKDFEGLSASVTGGVTPVYAAPETFDGRVTRHCDQYSLAIVYQELLTGVRPFNGNSTRQLVLQHLTQPPDLSALPEHDRGPVGRALAKKSDERFPSCTGLVQALRLVGPAAPRRSAVIAAGATAAPTIPPASPISTRTIRPGVLPLPVEPPSSLSVPQITHRLRPPAAPGTRPRDPTVTQSPDGMAATMPRPDDFPSLTASELRGEVPTAPAEKTGDGILRPALILGAGHVGGLVLRRVRAAIAERFGAADAAPHVRLLTIETDPDEARDLTNGKAALDVREVFLARLHRPSHYLQRRDGPELDLWLDPQLLYRIPRNPGTAGLRGLGRLALVDHVRDLRARLRTAFDAALDPAAIGEAEQQTRLGLRTTRPVVYVVANLGGGTGGGMALDLAYIARTELRRMGYVHPEVVGVLLLPPADRTAVTSPALANTHAALVELLHYCTPGTAYQLTLGARDRSITDSEAPFTRCTLVQLPGAPDGPARDGVLGLAAGQIIRDLFTPLGRAADDARGSATQHLANAAGHPLQAVAAYRLSWPRRRLLRRTSARLGEELLRQWTAREAPHIREPVRAWLDEQWDSRQLRPELLIDRLHAACAAAVGGTPPDAKFDAAVDPLVERGRLGSPLDAYSACQVLDDLLDLVGKPATYGEDDGPPRLLGKVLTQTAQALGVEYDQKFAEMAVHFIERPGFRLPAAEEAVRQLTERLRQVLTTYEQLHKALEKEADECYSRLFPLIGQLDGQSQGARKNTLVGEVLELMRAYPKKRYQMLVAWCVLSVFRGMLNSIPEYLREVNFCRQRLGEAVQALADAAAAAARGDGLGPCRDLFPGGDRSVDDASARLVQSLTAVDWEEFDGKVQAQVRKQFRAVITLCLEGASPSGPLAELVRQQAAEFVDPRLGRHDPAEMFFQHHVDDQAAQRAIASAFDEAAPELGAAPKGGHGTALTMLAAPPGPAGERFRALAKQVLSGEDVLAAEFADEIVVYREKPALAASDLPQLGSIGREAAQHALSEQMPPHSRTDVEWRPIGR